MKVSSVCVLLLPLVLQAAATPASVPKLNDLTKPDGTDVNGGESVGSLSNDMKVQLQDPLHKDGGEITNFEVATTVEDKEDRRTPDQKLMDGEGFGGIGGGGEVVPREAADPKAVPQAAPEAAPAAAVAAPPPTEERSGNDVIPEEEEEESTTNPNIEVAKKELPPSLTLDNFDKITSEKLLFVEFYSPYCGHCKMLAPIWEQTYVEFVEDMEKLNIQMRQVNCAENGNLCEREDISFYPNLLLYAPLRDKSGRIIPGKLKSVGSFPRSLTRTPENFKRYLKNAVAEYDNGAIDLPSSSVSLDVDTILDLVAGKADTPQFVAFFPSTESQWAETEKTGKNHFDTPCYDCLEEKRLWDKLSNQILSTVKAGHFHCQSNPKICEKLGYNALTTPQRGTSPKYAMFLPKSSGIIRMDYTGEVELSQMKNFAQRMFENYKYDLIGIRVLTDIMEARKVLPFEPLDLYYPLSNKVSLIYYHDEDSEEDRAILPYLLEYVSKSPFNMYLYQAKNKKFEEFINQQAKNLIEFINYDEKSLRKYDHALHLATTLTSKPTLLMFKDNTLFTPVYQNFAPEDMRNHEKIHDFVLKNQYPLYQELTPQLFSTYFNTKLEKQNNFNDKVVVSFIDSNDAKGTNNALYNISLIAHEYHYLKKEYYFNDLTNFRSLKKEAVDKLKENKAGSTQIQNRMKQRIPNYQNNDDVLFTFIDVATNKEFARKLGWEVSGREHQVGESIVVTKDDKFYWDQDIQGKRLTTDPYKIKPVLQYLLDPALVKEKVFMNRILVGSPYGDFLRFMDVVHQRGLFGYILFIAFLYTTFLGIRKLRRRRHGGYRKSDGLGILGGKSD